MYSWSIIFISVFKCRIYYCPSYMHVPTESCFCCLTDVLILLSMASLLRVKEFYQSVEAFVVFKDTTNHIAVPPSCSPPNLKLLHKSRKLLFQKNLLHFLVYYVFQNSNFIFPLL